MMKQGFEAIKRFFAVHERSIVDIISGIITIVIFFVIAAVFVVFIGRVERNGIYKGIDIGIKKMQKESVSKGFAEYNSKTGEWQWKEKKE